MTECETIVKELGFYGTIREQMDSFQEANTAWNLMAHKLMMLYKDKTFEELVEFLNSSIGRQLAEHLISILHHKGIAPLSARIVGLNHLSMEQWWDCYNKKSTEPPQASMHLLYRNALARIMQNETVLKEMENTLECGKGSLWQDAESWLWSCFTTTEEMKQMWAYLQSKFTAEMSEHSNKKDTQC